MAASSASATATTLPSTRRKVFISSADWMPRNLDRRVEALVPIENPTVHQQVLDQIMVANLQGRGAKLAARRRTALSRACRRTPTPFCAHTYFMTNPSLSGRGSALQRARAAAAPRRAKGAAR